MARICKEAGILLLNPKRIRLTHLGGPPQGLPLQGHSVWGRVAGVLPGAAFIHGKGGEKRLAGQTSSALVDLLPSSHGTPPQWRWHPRSNSEELFVLSKLMLKLHVILYTLKCFKATIFLKALTCSHPLVKVGPSEFSVE